MSFVYFNTQDISLDESATPHEYAQLLKHQQLNLPSTLGQLQMLCAPNPVVKFPINTLKGTIGLVRVLDNEWLWKIIIEMSDEFWN